MSIRQRDVQMHAIIYESDANGGPGTPKMELTPDMLNVVWQQALNYPGQAAISLNRFNPKLGQLLYMQDHIKLFRETDKGTRVVFAGKVVKPSMAARDAIIYCWDYASFLQRSRTGFRVMYPDTTIDDIVTAEWGLAKAVDTSPFAFVTTGTIEQPLGNDDLTPIQTNDQFGVIDFDRLFLFFALAELSMANTAHTVVFEITREEPHTFNFWKDRSVTRFSYEFIYPGNLIDYNTDTGHDQIVNDMATVIVDETTGGQTEYVLSDLGSIFTYRRLQAAVGIKTLYGIASGTTETDQQKAVLARMLSLAAVPPGVHTIFPRQNELDIFDGWDLGDKFRFTTLRPDRGGVDVDQWYNLTGVAAAWTPNQGELAQVYLRGTQGLPE